jgi:rubrerythrin
VISFAVARVANVKWLKLMTGGDTMVGVIRTWDILEHPVATIRSFGWRVFFRALFAGQGKTFLSLAFEGCVPTTRMPSLLERCISLELRAERIYIALSRALAEQEAVGVFFDALAEQERDHADLLRLCKAAAVRGRWRANLFNPWQEYLPRLEQQMDETDATVRSIDSVEAALRVVIEIESSEINRVFDAALAATDAAFVRKLEPFRKAMQWHLTFLVDRLGDLAPQLMAETRELRARFPRVPG